MMNNARTTNINNKHSGISCILELESGKSLVMLYLGSTVVKIPAYSSITLKKIFIWQQQHYEIL